MLILSDKIYGCLMGGLIGDAMGAPVEGKTYPQIQALYGEEGVRDFEGDGTDDTAIREQLIHALLENEGYITCDEFAQTFQTFRKANYNKWWVPVRNMFHKVDSKVALPVDAGYGNTPSSSSAMSISPMGIINAANPRQAVLETFDVAGLIHSGPSGFCRDAACAMAAAVAAAFHPEATVESVLHSAVAYLHPVSAHEIRGEIQKAQELARVTGSYESFREAFYRHHLREEQCDSRETVPVTLAIFQLAEGKPRKAILDACNFGRDADTIGTMVGGLCGAFYGAVGLPQEWVRKVEENPNNKYQEVVPQLINLIHKRAALAEDYPKLISSMMIP